ncbi:MAG: hypothetical protein JNK70_02595 [Phycisphaerae bacterium]|nr:hypothetical protein [Phycisphaerae bacterium]
MMQAMTVAGRSARLVFCALAIGLAAAASIGQVVARDPPPTPGPVPAPRPHTVPAGMEFDIASPNFIIPDEGICRDPEKAARKQWRPMRIDHRPTDIPVFTPDPDAWLAPVVEDTANDYQRARPLFQNFDSMGFNDLNPPDPDLATNGVHIVAVTNDDFAVYDTCGNLLYSIDIEDYLGTDAAYLLFDPKIIYDPWNGRWVMMWHKKRDATKESTMIIMVTSGATPFGLTGAGAYWYEFNMRQDIGTADESWADYYDLGFSNTAITFSGNQFRWTGGFRWARARFVDKTQIYSASTATFYSFTLTTNPDGSTASTPRAAKMQSSWSESGANIDGIFISSRGGGGSRLTIRKLTNAFSSAALSATDINVGAYTSPPNAVQPNGLTLDTIDCRLMVAVVTNDTLGTNGIELFTGLTTGFNNGTEARCHLFKLNPVGNTLKWESQFGATGNYYWFPSAAADYSGSCFWVFSRTANTAGNEPQARYVDFNKGTFSSSSSLLRVGDGNYNGFRWGDYLGGQLDWVDYGNNFSIPGRPAKVWLIGQYGRPNTWRTHIGGSSVFTQGSIANVTPITTWSISGVRGAFTGTTNRVYSITLTGETGIRYTISGLPSWLTASSTSGLLGPGGATVTLTLSNTIANTLAAGNYSATINFGNCFNGGSTIQRLVNLAVLAPDLSVNFVDAAAGTYRPGDLVSTQIRVDNLGTSASGAYTVDFYASINTLITTADLYMGSRSYATLAAGASRTTTHFLDAPCIVTERQYYIGAIINATNDSNASNNTGYDPSTVRIEFCPTDVDKSCFVDTDDFTQFIIWFEAGVDEADFDKSGFVDTDDFTAFVLAFQDGC